MKKLVCILAMGALVLGFASCKKEGQYMPKKKITQIVDTYATSAEGVSNTTAQQQIWKWGGDILSYIEYYDYNGNLLTTLVFGYDKDNRIDEIISSTSNESFKYTYSGKYLDKVEYSRNENLICTYTFVRKNKNIIEVNCATTSKSDVAMVANPFVFFMPEKVATELAKAPTAKGSSTIKLTWDGKNVVEATMNEGEQVHSFKWKYDNKINPFESFLRFGSYTYSEMFSQNNVVEETESLNNISKTTTFTYKYEGKYPVERTYTENQGELTRTVTRTFTY